MDAAQWPQVLVYDFHKEPGLVNPTEGSSNIVASNSATSDSSKQDKKRTRPGKEQVLSCPRCNSTNTKFCYYNNYNPTQPRHLCKACRRYWTHGGTLRNVPVGGSSRKKNKPSFTSNQSDSNKLFLEFNPKPTPNSSIFASQMHQSQDLKMGLYFAARHFLPIPTFEISASQGGFNSYHAPKLSPPIMFEANTRIFPNTSFHFQDMRPTLNLAMDGFGSTTPHGWSNEEGPAGPHVFPFGDLNQVSGASSTDTADKTKGHDSNSNAGFWNHGGYSYNQ